MQINSNNPVIQTGGDFLVLMVLIPLVCMARIFTEYIGRRYFLTSQAALSLQRKKKNELQIVAKKFQESSWKFVYYSFSLCFGVFFISWEPYLWDLFGVYPNVKSNKIYWYYMMQIAFYLWMSVCHIYDTRRKDFYQMAAHHFITLTLLAFSYTYSLFNIGALIAMIHDFADPFLEAAKMLIYLKKESWSTTMFVCFMTAFLSMRLVVYPVYAIYPSVMETYELASFLDVVWLYYLLNVSLVLLLGLNVFWSVLIVNVLVKKLGGSQIKDTRSDDESD